MGAIAPAQFCPRCGAVSKQLEWSEKVSEEQVALVWRCTSCGHECETRAQCVVQEPSTVELAQEFLPKLVVEQRASYRMEHSMGGRHDLLGRLHRFSGLSEDEVAAIGEHEHIPTIAASALADYLLKRPHGGEKIRAMIIDDIHESPFSRATS